jgi:nicotinate-nucleotide adenylyltransferase
MRIGILGGTFDPPHEAHVALARAACAALRLDRILIVPSGDPPYKKCLSAGCDRLEMARAAFRDVPDAEVSEIEISRAGASYAVDTVRALRALYPEAALTYILGADAVAKLPGWLGYDELRTMCGFAYAARSGACIADVPAARIDAALPAVSSSEARALIAQGKDARSIVPEAVADYIEKRGLYIADRPEDELVDDLRTRLSPRRFLHSLGVRDAAETLAAQNGLAPGKARIAGLLHDCAKNLSDAELLSVADEAGADADEKANPRLLHAPVGALIARTRYGVGDPEVLRAIRLHTVGGPGMTLLDMIVYVADYIEQNREPFPGVEEARACARTDIRRATVECARQTCDYTDRRGRCPHPATAEMILELEDGGIANGKAERTGAGDGKHPV